MRRERVVLTIAALFLLVHAATVVAFGTAAPGPVLSDLIQLALGGMVIVSCAHASARSEGLARSFWRLVAAAYMVWFVAQALGVWSDLFPRIDTPQWISNLLFCFWFVPLALAMFLDPDNEAGSLDTLIALDFLQAVIVCVAAYLYFFYLPKSDSRSALTHSMWTPYFVVQAFVAGSFLTRAMITRSRVARSLFGRFGISMALSSVCDGMYYYGPGRSLRTGAWFDILWSALLVIPLALAVTWKQAEAPASLQVPRPEKKVHTELFHLFYPLLVLSMSLQIARERLGLAAAVVFLSFVCSSARLLVTQHRLVQAQEALRREASRDSLTGLWNRKAILDIFERELLRAERHGGETVGVIMADVDHFKSVNDSRGHVAGDLVLRIIASEIASVVRPYDSVGRYGGEEFLIVAPNCSLTETWELAERIRACVANCSVVTAGSSVNVSLSLGIATGDSASDCEKLLHAADTALYQAKNAGRNCIAPTAARSVSPSSGIQQAGERKFWL